MNIYANGPLHHKNEIGLSLLKEEGLTVHSVYDGNFKYDQIHIFNRIQRFEEQECPHVYGPHFYHTHMPRYDFQANEYMNCLSPWLKELTHAIRPEIRCATLPFPVEVNKFTPQAKEGKPIIYFKQRDPNILNEVLNFFGNDFIIFEYGSYQEEDYLTHISRAPYCIWVGRHESQGFALQEAMSCDTPIFVLDVVSLRDETGDTVWRNFLPEHDLPATAASYFDDKCGLITCTERWKEDFEMFESLLPSYSPREFVVNNLSAAPCLEKWRNLLCS